MIFDLNKKIEMPDPKDALKGRDQSLTVSPKHYVNGEDVQGPYPNDYKELKVAMGCFWGAEKLFWQQVRKNLTALSWIRLESRVNHGIPDVLGTTEEGIYFTVELKVSKSNKVNMSPHQIAYHEERKNAPAFILVKSLLESSPRKYGVYLYTSDQARELAVRGLSLPAVYRSSPAQWPLVQEQLLLVVRQRTKGH